VDHVVVVVAPRGMRSWPTVVGTRGSLAYFLESIKKVSQSETTAVPGPGPAGAAPACCGPVRLPEGWCPRGWRAADGTPYDNTYSWYMRLAGEGGDRRIVEVIAFFDTLEFTDFWKRVEPA
jgi:hypothetical protein